jgi:hypothetical protein
MDHLHWTLSNTPAAERKVSRWVMSPSWWIDTRSLIDSSRRPGARPIWELPAPVKDPEDLLGLPVKVIDGAGPPHLEPRPEAEIALDTKEAEESLAAIQAGSTTLNEMRGGYILPVEVVKEQYRAHQNNAYGVMVLPEGAEYTPFPGSFTEQEASLFDSITKAIRAIDDVLRSLAASTTRTSIDITDEINLRERRIQLMEQAKAMINGPRSGVIKLPRKNLSNMTAAGYAETLGNLDTKISNAIMSDFTDMRR